MCEKSIATNTDDLDSVFTITENKPTTSIDNTMNISANNTATVENQPEKKVCNNFLEKILTSILNNVFEIVENKLVPLVVNKVNILSNILVVEKRKDQSKPESVWNELLHWPKHEDGQKRKRKDRGGIQMPYAITSANWLKFHQEQEKKRVINN